MPCSLLRLHPNSPRQGDFFFPELQVSTLATPVRHRVAVTAMEARQPDRALFGLERCQDFSESQNSWNPDAVAPEGSKLDFAGLEQLARPAAVQQQPPAQQQPAPRPPERPRLVRRLFAASESGHLHMQQLATRGQRQVRLDFCYFSGGVLQQLQRGICCEQLEHCSDLKSAMSGCCCC